MVWSTLGPVPPDKVSSWFKVHWKSAVVSLIQLQVVMASKLQSRALTGYDGSVVVMPAVVVVDSAIQSVLGVYSTSSTAMSPS